MNRSMSRVDEQGRVIEYAACASRTGMSDAEIRERARNAPDAIKRGMDAQRIARGEKPLWEKRAATVKAAPPSHVTLSGYVTPGTSVPVAAATDGLRLPERFAPGAFRASLKAIAEGRELVILRDGHDGQTLAASDDGTLTLAADDTLGLRMTAVIGNTAATKRLVLDTAMGKVSLSVGFKPRRVEIVREAGRRVRVVHEADVHHVALIRPHQGKAAYPSRVRAVMGRGEAAAAIGRGKAFIDAVRAVMKQEGER
jgi:HK97 family phage prohead protease